MSARPAHERCGHVDDEGMIATLGLLPGTWIGKVTGSTPTAPTATKDPRQASFRGCFRSLKGVAGRRLGARRGPALSRPRLKQHEMRAERVSLQEVNDTFQETFPEAIPAELAWHHGIREPAKVSSLPASARTSPVPPCDAVSWFPELPQRPHSSPSKGSWAAPRCRQTTPKGRMDVPSLTAAARAYQHLRTMRPQCGAWQLPEAEMKRPGVKQASGVGDCGNSAEGDEEALWRLHFPTGSEWAKTKMPPTWNFCRVTGPWANRMRSGSVQNYRQWGDGPQWTMQNKK